MWFLSLLFCIYIYDASSLPNNIRIGAIFGINDKPIQEIAFRNAIDGINLDAYTLPRSKLDAQIEHLPADDSFHAAKKVCHLLRYGVAGIFGPQLENTANHVQSICDAMEIPHIETRWNYKSTRDKYSINLYPHPSSLGQAYYDIVKGLKWKNFVILFDSNLGLVRLQSLLRSKEWSVTIRQLDPNVDDWRPILKVLKKSKETKFVIDIAQERIYDFLKQASQIGLNTEYYSYFITSLDMHLANMEDFRHSDTNITTIRLFDPNKPEIVSLIDEWMYGESSKYGKIPPHEQRKMTTEAALMYDAVRLFARSLDDLNRAREVDITELFCETDKTWSHGSSVINYMKWYSSRQEESEDRITEFYDNYDMANRMQSRHGYNNEMNYGHSRGRSNNNFGPMNFGGASRQTHHQSYVKSSRNLSKANDDVQVFGLTGLIEFDPEGFRTNIELEICELDRKLDWKKVGIWTMKDGVNYTRNWKGESEAVSLSLQNKSVIVITALTSPYSMHKENIESLSGNDRYEGFCIDLIDALAEKIGFNYTFVIEPNSRYGSKHKVTGEWDGMIKELMEHRADMAIVDFTITYEREEAVDFSMPFMNLGISIIVKKPQRKPPKLFSFMSPFSTDVWIYMGTAYLGVSVLLFALARMSPSEWDSPYPCIQDPDELENCFTLQNSLWFIIATFLCQGADIAPRAVSTRIVAGIWWFFTLIMISSYTANLAAFLTVERLDSPIRGAEDLAAQTKIKYGSKQKGATYSFFNASKVATYERMWATMSNTRPSVFTKTNDMGIERVETSMGKYAFLMESVSIEYEVERRCTLMQVGGLLDSKSYGIALPPGSPYTSEISAEILKLKETGIIHKLKTKWWKERKGGGACTDPSGGKDPSSNELDLNNVGGIFITMAGGSAIACLIACFEFSWKARKLAAIQGDSFCSELMKELKFIGKFGENEKPARKFPPRTDPEPPVPYTATIYSGSMNYEYGKK